MRENMVGTHGWRTPHTAHKVKRANRHILYAQNYDVSTHDRASAPVAERVAGIIHMNEIEL